MVAPRPATGLTWQQTVISSPVLRTCFRAFDSHPELRLPAFNMADAEHEWDFLWSVQSPCVAVCVNLWRFARQATITDLGLTRICARAPPFI
jgi:hypothetical protein